jgi:hypothetical protein
VEIVEIRLSLKMEMRLGQLMCADDFVLDFSCVDYTYAPKAVRLEICDWLRFHMVDPNNVPVDCEIRRDPEKSRLYVTEVVRDKNGKEVIDREAKEVILFTAIHQGEGPPLEFPKRTRDYLERECG